MQPEVYLFSFEKKDAYCLAPVAEPLRKHFERVSEIAADDLDEAVARFSTDACPVAVFTSTTGLDLGNFIRGGKPFVSIGLEHGVAPFKGYTYNERFLEYDCYISPTKMWAERLARRHPRYAAKFSHVAYPREDDLRSRVEQAGQPDHEAWAGAAPEVRDLVVFSWGADVAALSQLPDREGVVYLLHPASIAAIRKARFSKARVLLSDPKTASALIAGAARIFGDHSSMTLEAAGLHPKTYMFVDRQLYVSDCDLDPQFFDRASPGFGQVAATDFQLPAEHLLDLGRLGEALAGDLLDGILPVSAWAPSEMMPADDGLNGDRAAAAIVGTVERIWPAKHELSQVSPALLALQAVYGAYRDVLGRKPDFPSVLNHAKGWLENPAATQVKTLSLYNNFAQSPEGQRRWLAGNYAVPKVAIPPLGRSA